MHLALESWYTLGDISGDETALRIRLLPDFFDAGIAEPVVTLTIVTPVNFVESKAALERFREDFVNDIAVSEGEVELWSEYDDEPTRISGQSAVWTLSAYSHAELLAVIASIKAELDASQTESKVLRRRLQSIEDYSVELLHRAEAKRSLTNRATTAIDAKIEILGRVLARFRDA